MKLQPRVNKADHLQGNLDAPIELVEYGDYQCPHCGRAYPIVKSIQRKMGNKLKFVFRNFPLAEMHPDATRAAVAAEIAASQGKFWEMHDRLFENQTALDDENLAQYAADLGLDARLIKRSCRRRACCARARGFPKRSARWCKRYTHLFYQRCALRRRTAC